MPAVVSESGELSLPWLRQPLQTILQQQRGHALIIHGAPGDGAWDLALAVAQGWLCEGAPEARPCGHCGSCRLFRGWAHPDAVWLLPEALALEREMPVKLDERRKPSRQIRVDEVRAATERLSSTSGRGRGHALVALPAEAMNAIAASALLKTLEEPPPGTRLVLAAAEPARLLPTIRSRCQITPLPSPDAAQAQAWLAGQGVSAAAVLLAACSGRPLDALALHRAGLSAEAWSALPQRVQAGDASVLGGLGIALRLDILARLCHDAMCLAVGAAPRFFPEARLQGPLQLPRLAQWQRQLLQIQRHAEHPWNEPVLMDALIAEGQDALRPARA
ncbi:MAG: DNA polymerase III subunit delta' [Rubrivivax sp.]|nr:DNA polymerase III subunit delta' [Rubrivivax sp.]